MEAAVAAASSASAEACPRLDGLPGRDLADGLRVAEANTRAARMKGLAKLDVLPERLALHIPRCRSVHTVHDALPARPDLARQGRPGRPRRPRGPAAAAEDLHEGALGGRGQRRHRRRASSPPASDHECHLDPLTAGRDDTRQRSSSTAAHSPPNRRSPLAQAVRLERRRDLVRFLPEQSGRDQPLRRSLEEATHVEQERADEVGHHGRRPRRRLPPQVHAPHLDLGPVALRVHRRRLQRGRLDVDRQHRRVAEPRRRDRQHAAARAPVRQRAAGVELEQQLEARAAWCGARPSRTPGRGR